MISNVFVNIILFILDPNFLFKKKKRKRNFLTIKLGKDGIITMRPTETKWLKVWKIVKAGRRIEASRQLTSTLS